LVVVVVVVMVVVVVVVGWLLSLREGGRMVVGSGTVCAMPGIVPPDREFGAFGRDELKCLVKVTQRGLLFARVVRILIITAICPLVDHNFPFRIRRRWFRRWW